MLLFACVGRPIGVSMRAYACVYACLGVYPVLIWNLSMFDYVLRFVEVYLR